MSGKLIDQVHFAVGAYPVSIQNTGLDQSSYALGEVVNVGKYGHVTIVLIGGAFAGTSAITVRSATSAAGVSVSSDKVTIAHRYLCTGITAGSDTWVETDVSSSTWTWPATANLANVIEFDTASLEAGHEWVAVNAVAAGVGASLIAALYILSEPRYISAETAPTALTPIA